MGKMVEFSVAFILHMFAVFSTNQTEEGTKLQTPSGTITKHK